MCAVVVVLGLRVVVLVGLFVVGVLIYVDRDVCVCLGNIFDTVELAIEFVFVLVKSRVLVYIGTGVDVVYVIVLVLPNVLELVAVVVLVLVVVGGFTLV